MQRLTLKEAREILKVLKSKGYKNLFIIKEWVYIDNEGFGYNYCVGQYFNKIQFFKRFDIDKKELLK